MSIAELTENVQFTVDQHGHVTAVVVQPLLWRYIIKLLEEGCDQTFAQALRAHDLTDAEAVDHPDWNQSNRSLKHFLEVLEDTIGDEAYTTMLASEAVLRKEWDTPEEDAAWASL
ncbi:MAG: hypothetical protein R2911_28545 [Caldilineaceae bacterium]